jgi:hypothetical protein
MLKNMSSLHAECFRIGNVTASLREVYQEGTFQSFVLEVGRVVGDAYEPQSIFVDRRGLLAIYELINTVAKDLEAREGHAP